MCISNYLGGGLMSNAIWTGLPLRDAVLAAGPRSGATRVVLRGADGYTDTYSLEKALEPTTFVAYGMNGAPLPVRHGYPVRILTPGLFGEKSIKWVTRIELVDHDVKGFYEQQGWGPSFRRSDSDDLLRERFPDAAHLRSNDSAARQRVCGQPGDCVGGTQRRRWRVLAAGPHRLPGHRHYLGLLELHVAAPRTR